MYKKLLHITFGLLTATSVVKTQLPLSCAGELVRYGVAESKMSSNLTYEVDYVWDVDGGQIIQYYGRGDSIDVLWGMDPGVFNLSVTEVNAYCSNETSDNVDVSATGTLNLGNDTMVCVQSFELDAGPDGLSYTWYRNDEIITQDFNGDNPINSQYITLPQGAFEYSVVVESGNCVAYDTINILACDDYFDLKLALPTVFTPNGDYRNETFVIQFKENFPEMIVQIFDNWGRRVFLSAPGYPEEWDGFFRGIALPMDSYYYIIDLNEGLKPITGSISIVK